MTPPVGTPAPVSTNQIGWKTIVGGIIVAVAPVMEKTIPGFTQTLQAIFQAVGGIIGIIGVRHAIAKNGRGV